ncbi:MAG: rod shape-determining protein MreD [Cellvibrionales bacterium]|nr:rod shape-determining protein MreD [Cellvibrionales bacterium]HCH20308.1 rod shape-determining protein MreD [Cellvibrionales bacterium]|tara:strand:+ start:131 stop:616 length:486 start_codon:yes stop_codon:yes gene_type:complete
MSPSVADDKPQSKFTLSIVIIGILLLSIYPLPVWVQWLRPEFAALAVIYWVMLAPFQLGMTLAWFIGLSIDLLEGGVLGQHALALTIIAYICALSHQQLKMFSLGAQVLAVFLLVFIYQLITYWVNSLTGGSFNSMLFLLPALMSALFWPLLKLILDYVDF